MNIECGLGIVSGLGLIAALFAPAHRFPVIEAAGMTAADSNLTMIGMYPITGLSLGLIAALTIGLALTARTKALVGTGALALICLAMVAWTVLEARNAVDSVQQLRPESRIALEFTARSLDFQWGWIALGACAAAMILAGVLAWLD